LIASLPKSLKKTAIERLQKAIPWLSERALRGAIEGKYAWEPRTEQIPPPGDWRVWLLLAGRGFGKTRTGAEYVRACVNQGLARRIALVAPTALDARSIMVEGESGLLSIGPPKERPEYEPSLHRLTWHNGAVATLFSADEPNRLRGPQHDLAWCDELAAWRYPPAWDMLMFGLRLAGPAGGDPRAIVTTTPRPIRLIRDLLADPTVAVTRGRTADNAKNLAPAFLAQIVRRYEGTRLGRQELDAEILDDMPGALWTHGLIDAARIAAHPDHVAALVRPGPAHPELIRVVVAIDPAATSGEHADETGIIVAGRDAAGHGYVLADASGHYPPAEWARIAVAAYHAQHADRIVAEVNNGGDMVEAMLRTTDPDVPFAAVHAAHGKVARAEPVAALYEQGRVHHLGAFAALEDQMCAFSSDFDRDVAGYSPDRVDALVWALTELFLEHHPGAAIAELYRQRATEAQPKD
jgi:phage terminase large subunit-like protein